MASPINSQHL